MQDRPQTVKAASRAAPRWEPVARIAGTGERTTRLDISQRAIQWRARWRCSAGRIALSIAPAPASGEARHDARCPRSGSAEWIRTGPVRLTVAATARWSAVIEQQVDTPLSEPPLAAMRSAPVVARGRFYGIERRGTGSARLYRLATGRLALRLEDFRTAANSDLFVWLSVARRPRTTQQSFRARHVEVALLKSTIGDQNYLLPRRIDADSIRSVVIWCEPVQIAYAAASLRRGGA